MSDKTSQAFPPNGKVLVVGMALPRNGGVKYGDCVLWQNHWEFTDNTPLPSGVVAMVLPFAMKLDPMNHMKSWAKRRGVKLVEVVFTVDALEKQLKTWLGNGDVGQASRSTPSPPKPSPPPLPRASSVPLVPKRGEAKPTGELWIKTNRIRPLKGQPRTHFSKKSMGELVASIRAIGQITPILVKVLEGDPDYDYELIEGERRLRSCILIGLPEMLAVVREVKSIYDQKKRSFVANYQREGNTPLDTARYIREMMDYPEYSGLGKMAVLKAIAGLCGKTDVWAFNYLKLLDLPVEIQAMLEPNDDDEQALPQSMGMFLSSIESKEVQFAVAKRAVEKKLSVTAAKQYARELAAKAGIRVGSAQRTPKADYNIMRNCIRRAIEGVEGTLTMPHRTVDELFTSRVLADRQAVLHDIDKLGIIPK